MCQLQFAKETSLLLVLRRLSFCMREATVVSRKGRPLPSRHAIDVASCDRAVLAMAGSMMASGRSSPLFVRSAVYPQHFADQRVAPIVPMHAPKPMAPGVDRMLACAEERVVALRRAQQVRSEQKDLGETSRVTWRPPPTRDTRSHVLTPKPTPSTPSCKPSPHVTPKLILASQSAQELLDLSFRKTPKLSRPWSAGDAPPYAPQRQRRRQRLILLSRSTHPRRSHLVASMHNFEAVSLLFGNCFEAQPRPCKRK